MSYQDTVEQLYALGHELASTPSHKFDLAYVRAMLEAMGHPERRFPSVLIAGTNGKGSTAATLASILRVAGYKTGLYSSPHLVRMNERIRVNGEANLRRRIRRDPRARRADGATTCSRKENSPGIPASSRC